MTEIEKDVTLWALTGDRPIQVGNPMFNYEEGLPRNRSIARCSTYIQYGEEEAKEWHADALRKIPRSAAEENGSKRSGQDMDSLAANCIRAGMRDLAKVRITPLCEYELSGEAIL